MSIEEIEAQLCRTREAAAAGVSAGMDHQGLQIHTQGSTYYNVPGASPIKSEPQTTTFQPGQVELPQTSLPLFHCLAGDGGTP